MDGQILQDDLNASSKWEKDRQMSFSLEKCHIICFSTKKNIITPCILYGRKLNRDHHHSYLRIILSEGLKWESHVSQISSSAKQTPGIIRRNVRHTSVECKSKLYCSIVRP